MSIAAHHQTIAGYRALRDSVGAHRIHRDVLSVSGPDAVSYLQGQCSQDLDGLAIGATTESLLLSPQGKLDAFLRITRTGDDAFVLDTDPGFGEVVRARLLRFRLRVKVEIEPLKWQGMAVRGPDADRAGVVPAGTAADPPVLRLPVDWPGFAGFDLLGPGDGGAEAEAWVEESVPRVDEEAWEAVRIEAGLPVNGRELTEATIAAEAGLVERTVSFTKGCFTGQELVARLDSRGSKVARKLAGLVVASGSEVPPVGATVWTADGEHEVGQLTSVAWSPGFDAPVALATLHRRVSPPETVSVRWEADDAAHQFDADARPLPLVS
ncbi:MAG TPA: glycine cleavage T C-terminal barrel domain-containing protein [Acidimicrobiales bacterium]|jgi:folate-binding protein YgfZ|nr:glycine cleavage T C-terminal barrel domain-containing protein [Acidimicrobiales bacterium]